MKSSVVKTAVLMSLVWSLSTGTPSSSQTPDGIVPANEGICDDLQMATPGLYGLCVAFCEAQDCAPDFQAEYPFGDCRPSSPKLLAAYNRKKQVTDPDMPCIRQARCPCWTDAELDAFRYPGAQDATNCGKDASDAERFNVDQWEVFAIEGITIVSTYETNDGGSCFAFDWTYGGIPTFIQTGLSPEEFSVCEQDVSDSGADRGFACFP